MKFEQRMSDFHPILQLLLAIPISLAFFIFLPAIGFVLTLRAIYSKLSLNQMKRRRARPQ
jgi:hypothetical protein